MRLLGVTEKTGFAGVVRLGVSSYTTITHHTRVSRSHIPVTGPLSLVDAGWCPNDQNSQLVGKAPHHTSFANTVIILFTALPKFNHSTSYSSYPAAVISQDKWGAESVESRFSRDHTFLIHQVHKLDAHRRDIQFKMRPTLRFINFSKQIRSRLVFGGGRQRQQQHRPLEWTNDVGSNASGRMGWRRYQSGDASSTASAAEEAVRQGTFRRLWNSPVGLKTVHFWYA